MTESKSVAPTTSGGTLRDFVKSMEKRIAEVLPKHIQAERFTRVVLGECARVPKLALCSRESFALALLTCSQIGLEPSSPLGHVYLLPFGSTCTLIVGYKGYLELARRSGQIARINAGVVYESEVGAGLFEAQREPPSLRHGFDPTTKRPKDDPIVASYCVVVTTDGARYQKVLNRDDIDARRKRSRAANNGPWVTDFPAMATKSAVRALLSGGTVPISSEMAAAIDFEHRDERGEHGVIDIPADQISPVRTLDGLADQLEGEAQAGPATAPPIAPPPEIDAKPPKPPRKTRSDKGTTRGPKTGKTQQAATEGASGDGGQEPPPPGDDDAPANPTDPPGEPDDWDKALALGRTWGLSAEEVSDILAEHVPNATAPRWPENQKAVVVSVIETKGRRKQKTGGTATPPSRPVVA